MTRHLTPLRLVVACVVLLAANTAMSACGPVDDRPVDPNTVSDCAELDNQPPGCEP